MIPGLLCQLMGTPDCSFTTYSPTCGCCNVDTVNNTWHVLSKGELSVFSTSGLREPIWRNRLSWQNKSCLSKQ